MLHKITVVLGLGSVLLLMGGMLLASREFIPPKAGLALVALGGLLGMVAIVCAIAVIFRTQAFQIVIVGMVGLIPALVLAGAIADGLRYPPINDISTTPRDAPAFVHAGSLPENAGRDMEFPMKWAAVIELGYPDLAPAIVSRPPAEVFPSVIRAATDMPDWEITYQDPERGIVECVAKTRMLRFADDIVIRLTPEGDGKTRVDMRSKSREGRSDLGANAKRIRKFLSRLG